MADKTNGKWYTGKGRQSEQETWSNLPDAYPDELKHPSGYRGSEGLVAAVNVALELGMPLLLTGEPGCGKSRLADSLAWELGVLDWGGELGQEPKSSPLRFSIKSDTDSKDLFYRFDTLGRFHAAQVARQEGTPQQSAIVESQSAEPPPDEVDPRHFVTYQALGKAILYAYGQKALQSRYPGLLLGHQLKRIPPEPQRSVVLIDEIDKAPREVPNDLLNEIDEMSFEVPELFGHFHGRIELPKAKDHPDQKDFRPIVIITSNGERELPEAFLRRCVYYHVDLPPFAEGVTETSEITIEEIVATRLHKRFGDESPLRRDALSFFRFLRGEDGNKPIKGKRPSLAELLNWLYYLGQRLPSDALVLETAAPEFRASLSILLKHREDLAPESIDTLISDWNSERA